MRFNSHEFRLSIKNIKQSQKAKFQNFIIFLVSQCSVQSEVKKIILVKSSLPEIRFNPREVNSRKLMSHHCYYSLLHILVIAYTGMLLIYNTLTNILLHPSLNKKEDSEYEDFVRNQTNFISFTVILSPLKTKMFSRCA